MSVRRTRVIVRDEDISALGSGFNLSQTQMDLIKLIMNADDRLNLSPSQVDIIKMAMNADRDTLAQIKLFVGGEQ